MKAMILAAGLGTRMGSLTQNRPKPMLPLLGYPLICHTLYMLHRQGCSFAAINTYYLGHQIRDYLKGFPYFPIQFSEETELLGTGGGIARAVAVTELDGHFWVVNPDSIFLPDFSLEDIFTGALAVAEQLTTSTGMIHPSGPFGPVLGLVPRETDSMETGFSMQETGGPVQSLRFDRDGRYRYIGLGLLHESHFASFVLDEPAHVVDDWKMRAEQPAGLLGFVYHGLLLDAGDYGSYNELHSSEKAFPLTYRNGLEQFMQWKG